MIYLKSASEIDLMRECGKRLASLFDRIPSFIKEGITTLELDSLIESEMTALELEPVTKGYKSYKHATCISLNEVVVHGVPSSLVKLKKHDLVKVDVVARFRGWCSDMARSYIVSDFAESGFDVELKRDLIKVAFDAFKEALLVVKPGNYVYDISIAVQKYVEQNKFFVVREFSGHGIGKKIHEEPSIPNYLDRRAAAVKLMPGMTLAIEPMLLAAPGRVIIAEDGWTAFSKSRALAAHYEDTVLVTKNGYEVLTSCLSHEMIYEKK